MKTIVIRKSDKKIPSCLTLGGLLKNMSSTQTIEKDFLSAMKSKDSGKVSTLRLLKAALKNKRIDLRHELSEEETISVIKNQIKQLTDSVGLFEQAGRTEQAESIKKEIAVLEVYLPAQINEEILAQKVKEALIVAGIVSKTDIGKAMGVAMKAVAGQADGNRVRKIVETILISLVLLVSAWTVEAVAEAAREITFLEQVLRFSRVCLMLFGIAAINLIIVGAVKYMVCGHKDSVQGLALRHIYSGVISIICIIVLFFAATIAIQRM